MRSFTVLGAFRTRKGRIIQRLIEVRATFENGKLQIKETWRNFSFGEVAEK